jgi:GNAT superfamily N-acetyltransferase
MIRRLWARLVEAGTAPPPPPPSPPVIPDRLGPFQLEQAHEDPGHRILLFDAYVSSRDGDAELALRHPESRRALLEHEFESRQRGYPVDFPGVRFFLLSLDGAPAGRAYLQSASDVVFVVDLVLLAPWRDRGRGSAFLHDLIAHAHATGRPVRLHVAKNNPRAAALYDRFGFRPIEELSRHWLLELPVRP